MMKSIRFGLILAIVALMALPAVSLADDASTPSLTWSAWGRALFVPMASPEDGETVPRDTSSWGGDSRIGFTIKGESDRVGFWVDMRVDGGQMGGANDGWLQDQQKIWVKPFSFLTVEAGPTVFYDELRGNSMYGAWNWWRFNNIDGEDNIFLRGVVGGGDGRWHNRYNGDYEGVPDAGAIIHADKNNFHVFAAWNIVEGGVTHNYTTDVNDDGVVDDNDSFTEQYTTSLMIARGQYGFGYDIDGVGQARAQYIGKAYMKDDEVYLDDDEMESYGIINAAFKIDQLVKNLYLDMGVFLTTDDDAENTKIAIYGNYKIGRVTPHLLITAELDKQKYDADPGDDDDTDTGLKIGLGADIDLGSGLTLNLDLRIHNETAYGAEDGQTAYLVGIQKGFSNGIIGIGFQSTNGNFQGEDAGLKNGAEDEPDETAWAIPIKLEYWF